MSTIKIALGVALSFAFIISLIYLSAFACVLFGFGPKVCGL